MRTELKSVRFYRFAINIDADRFLRIYLLVEKTILAIIIPKLYYELWLFIDGKY